MAARGLALSGGGARGAYQVGCFRAFRELGVEFPIVAGTSVGALNGALYCLDDLAAAERIWLSVRTGDVLDIAALATSFAAQMAAAHRREGVQTPRTALGRSVRTAARIGGALLRTWAEFTRANRQKLTAILDAHLTGHALKNAPREMIITVTSLTGTHYESARDLTPQAIREHLQASASIPFVFAPVFSSSRMRLAWDGGANPFQPLAMTPIKPLYDRGVKEIVVVWLVPKLRLLSHRFPGARLIHIAPRKSLGHFLRFGPGKARRLMDMGYEDAMRAVRARR